jgi:type IV pilus assembly protein PilW
MRQRGFSLVEIMVAITLSLIILSGVLAVMYSSKVTYLENERVGRIQENGRAALEMILRDLRGAGFPGCAQPIQGLFGINNMLANPTETPWNLAQPIYGYEGSGGVWDPVLDASLIPTATADNDVVVVRTIPSGSPSLRVSASVAPTADITVDKDVGEALVAGTPAIISDCSSASIFVVGDFTPDGTDTAATITRGTSGGPPTNTTADLGATFGVGSRVAPITSVAYFIAPNSAGTGNALWRVISDGDPQELIPGVEGMQVQYGVDGNSTDGQVAVTEYMDANEITNWENVISVSLALLFRSAEDNSQTIDSREYSLLGVAYGPYDDKFQRSLFTTTVTLRNRTT